MTTDPTTERLDEIGASGRVDQLPELTQHLLGATSYSDDALRALHRLLSRCGSEGLVAIETRVRVNLRGGWSNWSNLDPSGVASTPLQVQRLATFHPSGHVREAAVKALVKRADPDDLAYFLLRMNDWVLPVATRARTAAIERLSGGGADWIAALPVVRYLRSTTRRDLQGVLDAMDAFLASPVARSALCRGLHDGPRGVRRAVLAIVERLPAREAVPLLRDATADSDPVVAAAATRLLGETLRGEARREVLMPLTGSAIPTVRYRALIAVCRDNSKDDEPILRTALLDSTGDVRAFAQGQLKHLGFSDVGASYRSRLATVGRHVLEAIHGLGECGAPEDADWVVPFARHSRAAVRVAVLRALRRLDRDRHLATFADALSDPSARVVRSAHEALTGCPTDVGYARLEALLRDAPTPAGACAALRLLVEQDYWTALEIALRALQHREPAVRAVALAHIKRTLWRQTYARPPDLPRLERVVRDVAGELPPDVQGEIAVFLQVARQMR